MVHEERRIRNALQTRHKMNEWSFETEEYSYSLVMWRSTRTKTESPTEVDPVGKSIRVTLGRTCVDSLGPDVLVRVVARPTYCPGTIS